MPEETGDIIVVSDGIVMSGISYSRRDGFYMAALEYDDDEPIDGVTHWMPLPEPPQGWNDAWPEVFYVIGIAIFLSGDKRMFSLIQRGQIYTDSAGYPVKIIRSTDHSVFFKRMDGYPGRVCIRKFNNLFEHIDHREYHQILAETEQENHLKKLRAMQRR